MPILWGLFPNSTERWLCMCLSAYLFIVMMTCCIEGKTTRKFANGHLMRGSAGSFYEDYFRLARQMALYAYLMLSEKWGSGSYYEGYFLLEKIDGSVCISAFLFIEMMTCCRVGKLRVNLQMIIYWWGTGSYCEDYFLIVQIDDSVDLSAFL
jgi:hypothetical protein